MSKSPLVEYIERTKSHHDISSQNPPQNKEDDSAQQQNIPTQEESECGDDKK
jgi:hypothetical protein